MAQHRVVGMEPYTEAQAWRDFHTEMITGFRAAWLSAALRNALLTHEWRHGEATALLVSRGVKHQHLHQRVERGLCFQIPQKV